MENRINTEEAQIFLTEYYKRYDICSEPNDWELLKKYKNFKGLTCRDFQLNSSISPKKIFCIVVFDNRTSSIQIIENENYEFFVKQAANAPVFYYAPAINNSGLVFYFETVAQIDKFGSPSPNNTQYKAMLQKKLNTLFGSSNVFSVSSGLFFSFPLSELDYIISVLESNYCKFNMELFLFLDKTIFQPIYPDVEIATHFFPEDLNKTQEEIIKLFFDLCSNTEEFTNKDLAHIKHLLKSIRLNDEFITCINITMEWDCYQNQKIQEIFKNEIIRRKNVDILKDMENRPKQVSEQSIDTLEQNIQKHTPKKTPPKNTPSNTSIPELDEYDKNIDI